MGGKFDRSMRLFSASWSVLREEKTLALYPFISAVTGSIVIATFALPILTMFVHTETGSVYSQSQQMYVNQSSLQMDPVGWLLAGIGYFVLIYVGIFCNAALIVAANERLTGTGPGTLASGFRGASGKAGAFVPWAILSATVTLFLRMLEERLGILGRIAVAIVGIAWTLVTYMVVPVLVLEEGFSTGRAIKRSSHLFKGTWGENVIGNAGFGIFSILVGVSAAVLFLVGVAAGTTIAMIVMGVLAAIWLLVATEVLAALSGIYRVALYRYAVDGQAPSAYATFDFQGAFRAKKASSLLPTPKSRTVYRSPGAPTRNDRELWRAWEPPKNEVDAAFGIDIPGVEDLPGDPSRPDGRTDPPAS